MTGLTAVRLAANVTANTLVTVSRARRSGEVTPVPKAGAKR